MKQTSNKEMQSENFSKTELGPEMLSFKYNSCQTAIDSFPDRNDDDYKK